MEPVTFCLLVAFIYARYFATDVIYAARGKGDESPRHKERMARIAAGRPVLADAGVRLVDAAAHVVNRYADRPRGRRGFLGYLADLKDDVLAEATERRRRKRSAAGAGQATGNLGTPSGDGPRPHPETQRPPGDTPPADGPRAPGSPDAPPPPGNPPPPSPDGPEDEPARPTTVHADAERLDDPQPPQPAEPPPPHEPLALPPAPPRDDDPQPDTDGSTTMTSTDVTTTVDGDISPEEALQLADQYTELGRHLNQRLEALIGALRANKVGDQVIAKFAQMQEAADTFVGQGEQAKVDFQQHIQLADHARGVEHAGGEQYLGMAAASRGGTQYLGIPR